MVAQKNIEIGRRLQSNINCRVFMAHSVEWQQRRSDSRRRRVF